MTNDPANAKAAFWGLYESGVRLSLEGNKLKVRRVGEQTNLRDGQRELVKRYRSELAAMISEKASAEMWSPAVRAVANAALDADGAPEARRLLEEAQDHYERGDTGMARYRLYQAVRAARNERSAA